MAMFTYVSLFSGIGGFETALNRLDGKCVMSSEIDKYANKAYEVLYGHSTSGDVTKIDAKDVPDHDVLVGGFPCQAFSVAGRRLGFDDARGTLFFEIARIARVKRPRLMLLENVKGLLSHDGGRTLDVIVQTLNEIGYTVDFNVLNSKYYGVAQNRERIFIVAALEHQHQPWTPQKQLNVVGRTKKRISQMLGVKTFNFDWPMNNTVTTRISDILETDVAEKYYLSGDKTAKLLESLNGYKSHVENVICVESDLKIAGTLDIPGNDSIKRVYDSTGISPTLTTMGGGNREPKILVSAILTPDLEEKRQNGRRVKEPDEPMFTLTAQDRHGVMVEFPDASGISRTVRTSGRGSLDRHSRDIVQLPVVRNHGEWSEREHAQCLDANYHKGIDNHGARTGIYNGIRIRKLTPLECFRLQGFPDDYHAKLVSAGISDSQLYKMAGNAVTVSVIDAIGKHLIAMLDKNSSQEVA